MINVYDQVPAVYTNTSRDFQYLSWLINIVLNAVKHNVDGLYDLPNIKDDSKLIELLAMTLGFKVKRNYDQKQLSALVSIFPSILKCKGTKKAITLAGEALVAASGASGDFFCDIENGLLEVILPEELVDITLFLDLLPYILPAGTTCRIIKKNVMLHKYTTEVEYHDSHIARMQSDLVWNSNTNVSDAPAGSVDGLSTMFDINKTYENRVPTIANYEKIKTDASTEFALNTGLLDNSIIPVLKNPLGNFTTLNSQTDENS